MRDRGPSCGEIGVMYIYSAGGSPDNKKKSDFLSSLFRAVFRAEKRI